MDRQGSSITSQTAAVSAVLLVFLTNSQRLILPSGCSNQWRRSKANSKLLVSKAKSREPRILEMDRRLVQSLPNDQAVGNDAPVSQFE